MKTIFILLATLVVFSSCSSNKDEAMKLYNRAIKQNVTADYKGAIVTLNKAIDLDPDFAGAYLERGNAKFNENKFDEAMADFSKAIELKNDYADAYYNRGMLQFYMNDMERACQDWHKADENGRPDMDDKLRLCH